MQPHQKSLGVTADLLSQTGRKFPVNHLSITQMGIRCRHTLTPYLSSVAQEKEGYGSRSGMGSNGCPDGIDQNFLDSIVFPDQPCHILRIFLAIAVADENFRIFIPVSYTHLDVYKRQG